MVSLPIPKSLTADKVRATTRDELPKQRLSLSACTGCNRRAWYDFLLFGQGRDMRPDHSRSGDIAIALKAVVIRWLTAAGMTVETINAATGEMLAASGLDGHLYSPIDGIVTGVPEAPTKRHLLIVAALKAADFTKLERQGVEHVRPEVVARAQLSMHLLGVERTLFAFCNRDTGDLGAERIRYDAAHAGSQAVRAEWIVDTRRAPARISESPEFFVCAHMCSRADICHGGVLPPRHCRTCLHVTPINDGQWYCDRHEKELSFDDQLSGCPNHLFIPDLVPGEQVDADTSAETVTYELGNGQTWIDGAERRAA